MIFDFIFIEIGIPEFYLKLAEDLISRGYNVGIISGNPKKLKKEDNKLKNIFFIHIDELISNYKNRINYDEKAINHIKETYNIPNIKSFYFPHFFYRMSQCGYYDFYEMSNNSESEVLFRKTIETFQAIECFFEENTIKYTIQNQGGEILRRAVYYHNKQFNIPNIIFGYSPIPGNHVLVSNEIGRWNELNLRKYYELSHKDIEEAQDFINKFRNKGTIVNIRNDEKRNYLTRFVEYLLDNKQNNGLLTSVKIASEIALIKLKKRILYPRLFKSPDQNDKFLFFPLHYHAESRLTLQDPHCWRQEFIVELVARSIPHGYKLYVKPHPEWKYDFPYEGLKIISKISNVVLLPPHISSVSLIKKCEGVVVMNSTAGFEALIYEKPVIMLGTEFYGRVGITYDVDDLRELPDKISKAITTGINPNDLICFISAFLKANRNGSIYRSDDENIKAISDGIINYIDISHQ